MKRKTASEIFHPVDLGLNVIDRYTGRKTKARDWKQTGGAFCPQCNQEAVRFRPRDGLCLQCVRDLDEKQDRDDKKRARQLKFINQHNARIDKKKRGT